MKPATDSIQFYSVSKFLSSIKSDFQYGIQAIYLQGFVDTALQVPTRSDHFVLVFVLAGNLRTKINLIEYDVKQYDIIVLSPQSVRQNINLSEDVSMATIIVTKEFLSGTGLHKKHTDSFEFLSPHVTPLMRLEPDDFNALVHMVDALHAMLNITPNIIFIKEILNQIFGVIFLTMSSIYLRNQQLSDTKGTRKEELTLRFMKMLALHYKTHRSITFYAGILNVTPKYLSHTIKLVTEKSAIEFINEMVILEAKVLLNNLALSIGQVAHQLNFSDQFFFSKFFKKHSALTPSEYRKTHS
jgi:AraC family transcriptional activator of pobA